VTTPAEPVGVDLTAHLDGGHVLVETMGIEPTTPCLQSRCSAN
jgi:hypothetical protein